MWTGGSGMIDEANVNNIATIIFEGIKWEVSDEEIKQLSNNILALERRGLSQLNKRLTEGGKKIWDTIAEHNFGYELIEHHPHNIPILYEPNEFEGRTLRRPPDFVIQKNGITFWIQMKKLSRTERENRQSNAVKQIKRLSQNIKVNKFFWCNLSENFSFTDVKPLVDFISSVAVDSIDEKKYLYPSPNHIKAEVTFWKPNKSVFEHLTLGGSGDLNCVNVTGDSRTQIRGSLTNAAGAFDWDIDEKNINLIAMEIGNASHYNIDIGESLFGNEVFTYGKNGRQAWYRKITGFFNDPKFYSKVAGIIAVKRKEHLPVSRYNKLLFINERYRDRLDQIHMVMDFDRIIFFNELI